MNPTVHFQGRSAGPEEFVPGVMRAASALRALGVGEGDVVALMMRNHPAVLELTLAARHVGAYWCPINWHFKREEVAWILADSAAKVFVADAALLAALGEVAPPGVAVLSAHGEAPHARAWEPLRDAAPAKAEEAARLRGAMLYTSGTTGRPKGIRRAPITPEAAQQANERVRLVLGLEDRARALVSAPLYHSAPGAYVVAAALQQDAHVFIEPRFDAEATLALIARERITHAYLVPTMYVRLLKLPEEVRRRYDVSSMRFVASTGSPCPPDVKRAMIEWWGPVIYEAYGSSELGYMTLLTPEQALAKPGSAGRPMPGVHLRILDDEGRELPTGTPGLIYVHNPRLVDFTYNDNEAARRAMERDGWLTMGDIGYLDEDNFLFISDRAADMVISGGVNIYPAEIEAVLHGMPGVADCAVFGIPDAEFGEALAAAVQPMPGATLDEQAVRDQVRAHLADYKVPKVVTFHEALPREDTGKIFKRRLREPYWAGMTRRI